MGRQPAAVDFALIGHQPNWETIAQVVNDLRQQPRRRLSLNEIRELAPWIPPRTVARLAVRAHPSGREVRGIYVETFINPDDLGDQSHATNRQRIRQAIDCAAAEGARIVALGGITKIGERDNRIWEAHPTLAITTGNTLTVALIVKGVETALRQRGQSLDRCALLIVGASGDVGSGCTNYFADKASSLLLCVRNRKRLERQRAALNWVSRPIRCVGEAAEALPQADIVISAASVATPCFSLASCKPDALVFDTGFPRNVLYEQAAAARVQMYYGGLGIVARGFEIPPHFRRLLPLHPHTEAAHGCLLEAPLLALAGRCESYSRGRGNITTAKVEEIWQLAGEHGFNLAP